jgi:hypothetical protein
VIEGIVAISLLSVAIGGACIYWTAVKHGRLALVLALVVAVTTVVATTGLETIANILMVQST